MKGGARDIVECEEEGSAKVITSNMKQKSKPYTLVFRSIQSVEIVLMTKLEPKRPVKINV